MLGQSHIRPQHTLKILSEMPGLNPEAARSLLDPADKQNVPKAVSLIQQLMSLRMDSADHNTNLGIKPSEYNCYKLLEFMGQFLGAFTRPFIDVTMSLSDQLTSIAIYAHVAMILWQENKTSCMTSQLYADSQAVVKNLFFTIARLQVINPNHKFYLIHEGSDRLENLFADVRTLDHGRNFDSRQLTEKMSIATLIHATYERNPDLDRGHRRLNLKGAMGVDHVNPKTWEGNTCVGSVDLQQVWISGQERASEMVHKYLGQEISQKYKFSEIFSLGSECDLLRPSGPDQWVGYDETHIQKPPQINQPVPVSIIPNPTSFLTSQTTTKMPVTPPCTTPLSNTIVEHGSGMSSDDEDGEILIEDEDTIEDYLPDTVDERGTEETHQRRPHTLSVNGRDVSIDSLVSSLSTKHWKRVTMRTLRVQERTIEHFTSSSLKFWLDADDADNNTMMKIGDLCAFLAQVNDQVALAVLEVTGFRNFDSSFSTGAVKYSDMAEPGSQIRVAGQICHLLPSELVKGGWESSQQFVPLVRGSGISSRAQYTIEVASVLVYPLSPGIVTHSAAIPHERLRWLLHETHLDEKLNHLWDLMGLDNTNSVHTFQSLPTIPESNLFPYRSSDGMFIHSTMAP